MPVNGSIHGLQAYRTFVPAFNYNTFQAFQPFIYIIPTIVVMIIILIKYRRAKSEMNSAIIDTNIFTFIMMYFLFNMLFFFGDYIHLNLPNSGLVTSFCAGIEPNRVFSLILVYAYSTNFGVICCPFMVCLMRLIILISPRHHERYCQYLKNWFAIPFIFLVPLALTSFNITTTGYCKQLNYPYDFGSIILYEGDDYARINIYIHLSFSCCLFVTNTLMTFFMFYKLRMTHNSSTSNNTKRLTRKAEFSLFLAIVSSVVPFITNSICSTVFLINRDSWESVLFLRPIGNDFETTMMPWVLFLSHPMFRSKKTSAKISTVSMSGTLQMRKKSSVSKVV
uniref:Serpentine Receptor, class T n=2 Tax=Caenorhabditis tropicalis TaxID=1561998 RepID=A0A1I7T7L6_9PELO